MEHLDDLHNLEEINVVNGRTGYDASSANQSYLAERLLEVPFPMSSRSTSPGDSHIGDDGWCS